METINHGNSSSMRVDASHSLGNQLNGNTLTPSGLTGTSSSHSLGNQLNGNTAVPPIAPEKKGFPLAGKSTEWFVMQKAQLKIPGLFCVGLFAIASLGWLRQRNLQSNHERPHFHQRRDCQNGTLRDRSVQEARFCLFLGGVRSQIGTEYSSSDPPMAGEWQNNRVGQC